MIRAEKLSYGFPQKDLYEKISFTLEEGRHCAVIGSNGSGKTTLAELIREPEKFTFDGTLTRENVGRIGYVTQFAVRDKDQSVTVTDYLMEDFEAIRREIDGVCARMETAEDLEPLMEEYQKWMDELESIDGDNCEQNIRKKLRLAELEDKGGLQLALLSGGEYKLVQVIRQMLRRPGLLIMDEPDVFLDFENLNGLRDLINAYKGTLLVVTHSRYLLNHCFDQLWHLEGGDLQEFDGNFKTYQFKLLEKKIQVQAKSNLYAGELQRAEEMVERLRDAATEFVDPTLGRMLKGKVAYLERWKTMQIKQPFVEIQSPEIRLPQTVPTEEDAVLLTVENYGLTFDEKLLENVSFEIKAKQKIAIVGPNGTGKTSFLREIRANENPTIRYSQAAQVGFFSQLQEEALNADNTIRDEFLDAGLDTRTAVEEYLGKYCFGPEGLGRKIGRLSGGEKNLLQLAKLAMGEKNLLLLDEPSSHLDTFAQIALEQAIADYEGAILMVSHDFYTVANCMDSVLFVENGTIRPMSIRAFRKMIYKHHFDKEYLELETRRKELETRIARFLEVKDTENARKLLDELAPVVEAVN